VAHATEARAVEARRAAPLQNSVQATVRGPMPRDAESLVREVVWMVAQHAPRSPCEVLDCTALAAALMPARIEDIATWVAARDRVPSAPAIRGSRAARARRAGWRSR
jgi:hypothetical protein